MSVLPQSVNSQGKPVQSKEILSDSINTYLAKSSQISCASGKKSSRSRSRRRSSSSLATIRRSKDATHRIDHHQASNSMQYEAEILKNIEDLQNDQLKNQQAKLQRDMYNAKQTPLILLIADLDLQSLDELSQEQNDLLTNILSLFRDAHEMCSFFEQFRI